MADDDKASPLPRFPKPYPAAKFSLPSSQEAWGKVSTDRRQAATPSRSSFASSEDEDPSFDHQKWQDLIEALRLHRRRLLRMPGVTGIDVGYKIENGYFTDKLALRVHVERKLPPSAFKDRLFELIPKSNTPAEEILPEQQYLTSTNTSVLMDVIEAEYKPDQLFEPPRPKTVLETPVRLEDVNRLRRLDPLVGGISIGSPQVPVGTLGALVWDKVDGSVCILSNWHVLAGDLQAEVGNPCFQPGLFDQGRSSDIVARLKRWSFDRQTDAAIAELIGNRHYCAGEIVSLFQQITGVAEPYLGMKLLKSGRSTDFSMGFVDGLFFSAAIEYSNGFVRVFEDQIHIAPQPPKDPSYPASAISEPGDSGSVWVTETSSDGYKAVGLHFAGDLPNSAFGEYALANPMNVVADRLKFSFRPLFLEVRDENVISPPSPTLPTAQIHVGNGGNGGAQPVSIILGGLTGAGNQPVDNQMGGGGTPQPNPGP